jgi:hypothetical protein
VRWDSQVATLVAKVGTASQANSADGVIRITPVVALVNSVTICAVVCTVRQ